MATNLPYELKGTPRSGFEVDKAQLKDFRALESDWREIFRWIMSVGAELPLYDDKDEVCGKFTELWHNDVLTVLVDISQKSLNGYASSFIAENGTANQVAFTTDLKAKFEGWIRRLDTYLHYARAGGTLTSAMQVAETIREQLHNSLPEQQAHRDRGRPMRLDDKNRPYFTMLGTLSDIQSKTDYYVSQIETSGDMDAAQSLLLVFTKHYCDIIRQFNDRFSVLPSFYRKKILKAVSRPAVQDSTFVVITPDREVADKTFIIQKNTGFVASETADGSPLIYSLREKARVLPAIVSQVRGVFRKDDIAVSVPATNSSIPLLSAANPHITPLAYGWLIASHLLAMNEGCRKVTLSFVLDNHRDIPADGTSFLVYASSEEGWSEKIVSVEYKAAESLLSLTFVIEENEPPLAPCNAEVHGVVTEHPAVRILANNLSALDGWCAETDFKDIRMDVGVSGIRDFTLYGDTGELDSSQPFYPFGAIGEPGSWFVFGSDEMNGKKLSCVELNGLWNKLPSGGFRQVYCNYPVTPPIANSSFKASCERLAGSSWQPCSTFVMPLFKSAPSGAMDENAVFSISLDGSEADKGLFRIRLTEPATGFGMNLYRQLFAETMTYNSRHSEKRHKPVPAMPQIPLLSDVTLGYSASENLASTKSKNTVLRISDTGEYEPVELNAAESYRLLPKMDASYLYIHLQNTEGIRELPLYFDIRYSDIHRRVSASPGRGKATFQYYVNGTGKWHRFPDECIVTEDTYGLTRSGYITLKFIDEAGDIIRCNDNLWLRLAFERNNAPENIILNGILVNCFRVTAQNGDGNPLPSGSIAGLVNEDNRIAEISQPMKGYGGKSAEDESILAVRQSTRVSTRNRLVNKADYEKMVLEQFADIEKVCAIPTTGQHPEIRVVVFPKPEKRKFPQLPNWKLSEIERYLKPYMPAFAKIRVINPTYEPLTVSFTAIVKSDVQDIGDVKRSIYRRIHGYFLGWSHKGELPELGRMFSREGLRAWTVNDAAVEMCVELKVVGGKQKEIYNADGNVEDILYMPSTECGVLYPEDMNIDLTYRGDGIGDSVIGVNFIIG